MAEIMTNFRAVDMLGAKKAKSAPKAKAPKAPKYEAPKVEEPVVAEEPVAVEESAPAAE